MVLLWLLGFTSSVNRIKSQIHPQRFQQQATRECKIMTSLSQWLLGNSRDAIIYLCESLDLYQGSWHEIILCSSCWICIVSVKEVMCYFSLDIHALFMFPIHFILLVNFIRNRNVLGVIKNAISFSFHRIMLCWHKHRWIGSCYWFPPPWYPLSIWEPEYFLLSVMLSWM